MTDTDPVQQQTPAAMSAGRRWMRRGGEIVLILALLLGVRAWQQRDVARGSAPTLFGKMLDGKSYVLAPSAGQPVLVHFWATWCPICRAEQGSIDALARDYPTITVAMQSGDARSVARHLQAEGLKFPVINDPDGRIASQWGVRAVPASFVVDATGRIRFVEIGYTTGLGLRLRLWLVRHWPQSVGRDTTPAPATSGTARTAE